MNKLIAVGVIIALLANIALMLILFGYLQDEINQLKLESDSSSTPSPTVSPTPTPVEPKESHDDDTSNYTFTVYRWTLTNGTVTREMLDKYYATRTLVHLPLLFTYQIGETSGFAAYRTMVPQTFSLVAKYLENSLSTVSEWNKTKMTFEVKLKDYVGDNAVHMEYATSFQALIS